MKLTAKVNGVQQEIELTKEDVYVVECVDKERANKVLKSVDESYESMNHWKYVSNKPIFDGKNKAKHSHIASYEPIPPNTPIISFEDWERLMAEKELPKEFCFVCDENSKEQIKKFKIYNADWSLHKFGLTYYVSNGSIRDFKDNDVWCLGCGKDAPLISLADYLPTESDKEEPKPTKWRFKTQKEFDDTCEKDDYGDYICGKSFFVDSMFRLFGKEYVGSPDNLIRHDNWLITPEMLMPLEESNDMIPNEPNWGEVKPTNPINSETKNYAFPVAPTQKWEKFTKGGIKVLETQVTFDDYIVVKAEKKDKVQTIYICYPNGVNKGGNSNFDLIPLNRESILKEIEEHKQAIVELEKKLN